MDDIFQYLIGSAPTGIDRQAQLAQMLRQRKGLGQIAMLSGDKTIAPVGQEMSGDVDRYANQIQQTRLKEADDKTQADRYAGDSVYRDRALAQAAKLAEENNARALEVARLQREALAQNKDAAQQFRADQFNQRQAGALSRLWTQNKMGSVGSGLKELNGMLSEFKDANSDIPGIGRGANLPGANWVLSEKGKAFKSAIQQVANDLLSMYAGMSVTLPESERRDLEMMRNSAAFTEKDFRNAWPRMISRYNSVKSGILGMATPEQQQLFVDNSSFAGSPVDIADITSSLEDPNAVFSRADVANANRVLGGPRGAAAGNTNGAAPLAAGPQGQANAAGGALDPRAALLARKAELEAKRNAAH